jgi:molybdenum cofactor biosynthesis enzyme MoaA
MQPLIDTFGRTHNNLRISVTDRCNLRCVYCMPEEVVFQDKSELLTFEEITRFVEAVVPLGINKLRLTGGEPLLRQDLPKLRADAGAACSGAARCRLAAHHRQPRHARPGPFPPTHSA